MCVSRVCKCAHVCSVLCASRLSAPSMRPLLLGLVVVSVALPGCSTLFSLSLLLMHGLSAWTHSPGSWPFVAVQMVEVDTTLEKS